MGKRRRGNEDAGKSGRSGTKRAKRANGRSSLAKRTSSGTSSGVVARSISLGGSKIEEHGEGNTINFDIRSSKVGRRSRKRGTGADGNSRSEFALKKTTGRGRIDVKYENRTSNIDLQKDVGMNVYVDRAEDNGVITGTSTNETLNISVGGKPVPVQSRERRDNVGSVSRTHGNMLAGPGREHWINVTVRDEASHDTERVRISSFEKVSVIWEKIGRSQGHQKLVNSENVTLVQDMNFRDNGVQDGDVIRVVTEAMVVSNTSRNSRRVR